MGKEIVRQESPKVPGKRSRLWKLKDIIEVFRNNTGTCETEIICLKQPKEMVEWNGKAFKKMKKLKTLIIRDGKFSKNPKYLPNSLRVLEWSGYPSHCLPPDFQPKSLAICKLPNSCFTSSEFYDPSKKFVNLKVLNFDGCECLRQISIDVSSFPNLEKLSFAKCENLITVHESVGFLEKLKVLSADRCRKLTNFPPLKLTSLENLDLSYCSSLERFPEILGKMENIRELELRDTSIKELPSSFQNLIGLRQLSISLSISSKCRILQLPGSIVMMPELTEFYASGHKGLQWLNHEEGEEKVVSIVSSPIEIFSAPGNNLCDDFFSIGFTTRFAHVKELDLSKNNFTIIPQCIKQFQFLWRLDVSDCKHLREIEGIPPSLKHFYAKNCKSLACSSANILLNKELHEAGNTFIRLTGERIPEWLDQHSRGPSISFWFRNKFPDKILCLVIGHGATAFLFEDNWPHLFINGNSRGRGRHNRYLVWSGFCSTEDYNTYLFDLRELEFENSPYEEHFGNEWNHVEVTFRGDYEIYAEFGIHIFKQESCMEDVRFTDPYDPYGKRKLDNNLNSLESQNPAIWNKFCTTLHDWLRWNYVTSIGPADVYIQFGIINELTCRRRNELMSSKKWEMNSSLIAKKHRLLQEIRRAKKHHETFSRSDLLLDILNTIIVLEKQKNTMKGVMEPVYVMCDGAVSYANQKAVCAAVITDHMDGRGYLGGFAKDLEFMSPIEAQLWGVFYGIRFAIAKGFSYLRIHSDSRQAVDMLERGIFPPRLSHLGQHIKSLVENLQHVFYWHSGRDMNIVAYLFAKHGLSVDDDVCFFDSPPSAWSCLHPQANGLLPLFLHPKLIYITP